MALPIKAFLCPVRFTAANPTIRVVHNGTGATLTIAVATDTDYYLSGDGASDDLATILQTALRTHPATGSNTIEVSVGSTNIITITSPSNLQILGSHVGTTVDLDVFGFTAGADTSAATSTVAPLPTLGYWSPDKPHQRDTLDQPIYLGSIVAASGTSSRGSIRDTGKRERRITYSLLAKPKVLEAYEATRASSLEYAWSPDGGLMCGADVRIYDDRTSRTSYVQYRSKSAERPWSEMEDVPTVRYEVALDLLKTGSGP